MSFFAVAIMYLGAVMGAGFASGREAWQYFGVFGNNAYYGIVIEAFIFILLGVMTVYNARTLHTENINHVILPIRSIHLERGLNILIGALLYLPLISMAAAGGALLNQELGIHKAVGGGIIVILVILTLLGDFDRMQRVFRYVMPILFVAVITVAIIVTIKVKPVEGMEKVKPSPLAPTWPIAALLYVSYNSLGTIPVMTKSALRAKDRKTAILGAIVGGLMLSSLGLVLVMALQRDPLYSDRLDLPLLGFAGKISTFVEILFSLVLLIAIYSAATSCYFGCISRFPNNEKRKYILVILAILAFFISLVGFKNIVAIVYPIKGYIDLIVLSLLTINFIKTFRKEKRKLKYYRRRKK